MKLKSHKLGFTATDSIMCVFEWLDMVALQWLKLSLKLSSGPSICSTHSGQLW